MNLLSKDKPLWLRAGSLLLAVLLIATALFFIIGGVKLLSLGGSAYFLISGVLMLISGIQLLRLRSSGALLYLMTTVGTVIWALADAGLSFWPLISRLMFPGGLAILAFFLLPSLRRYENRASLWKGSYLLGLLSVVGLSRHLLGCLSRMIRLNSPDSRSRWCRLPKTRCRKIGTTTVIPRGVAVLWP